MVKELPLLLDGGDMRKLSVCTDRSNEDWNRVKRKIRILDHPKNLLEVLRARLAISQGGNSIPMGPTQYHLTQTFLNGEALHILT